MTQKTRQHRIREHETNEMDTKQKHLVDQKSGCLTGLFTFYTWTYVPICASILWYEQISTM